MIPLGGIIIALAPAIVKALTAGREAADASREKIGANRAERERLLAEAAELDRDRPDALPTAEEVKGNLAGKEALARYHLAALEALAAGRQAPPLPEAMAMSETPPPAPSEAEPPLPNLGA